jgi:asparagine synthase (glutamine-hydrolysing)
MQREGLRTQKYVDDTLGVAFGCEDGNEFPAFNRNRDLLASFRGEIYNKTDLVRLLDEKDQNASPFSDGELFANLYGQFREGFLEHLRGTFSAAVFDLQTSKLLLFRDRFGETPMYYSFHENSVVFSSEFNSIISHEEGDLEIDDVALGHYLSFGHVPAPRTIFKGIQKLPPACVLQYSLGGSPATSQYWDIASTKEGYNKEESVLLAEIYSRIMDCVKIRSSDLDKSGVLLSGGLDSGAIAAFLTKALNGNVTAFSVIYENPFQNEIANIEKVAGYLGIDHHVKMIEPKDINEELIRKIVTLYGEPCANSSVIASYFASGFSSQFVSTVFTGDGGDETFLGYSMLYWRDPKLLNFYSKLSLLKKMSARLAKPIFEYLAESRRDRKYAIGLDFFERRSMSDPDPEIRFAARVLARFFSPEDLIEFGVNSDAYDVANVVFQKATENGFKNPRLYEIISLNLVSDTYKVGRSSRAFSISTRSPLLDHKFMEFMSSIPSEARLKNSVTKYLLRKMLLIRKMLPREIIESRSKRGFETPIEDWLSGELKELAQSKLVENPIPILNALSKSYIQKLVSSRSRYRSLKTWNLLILSIWYDVYIREH